ncbi:MAG TPA: hypothetical protein VHP63_07525 [candidate division Zixibacteria bacterium]|nr:hypothetical protein [candidate division Zixibacteria bacterium]
MKSVNSIVILTVVFLIVACQEKAMNPAIQDGPDFSVTPMENQEAELIALHLSGELIAPVPLYRKVKKELEIIRNTWIDSIPEVGYRHTLYIRPSLLQGGLSIALLDSIVSGTYTFWDSLNLYYGFDSISIRQVPMGDTVYNYYILHFKGRLNSCILQSAYSQLPGFEKVKMVVVGVYGPTLCASIDGDNVKYFFTNRYGDCLRGCIYKDFYYFTVIQDQAVFHGSYLDNVTSPPDSSRPNWVDTAVNALYMTSRCP